jgi:hypothetical protein
MYALVLRLFHEGEYEVAEEAFDRLIQSYGSIAYHCEADIATQYDGNFNILLMARSSSLIERGRRNRVMQQMRDVERLVKDPASLQQCYNSVLTVIPGSSTEVM